MTMPDDEALIRELEKIAEGSKTLWPSASPIIKKAAKRLRELTRLKKSDKEASCHA